MKRGRPPIDFNKRKVSVTIQIEHLNLVSEFGARDLDDFIELLIGRSIELRRELENLRNSQSVLDAETTINQQQNP